MALLLFPLTWFMWVDLSLFAADLPRLKVRLTIRAVTLFVPIAGIWFVRRAETRESLSRIVLVFTLVTISVLLGMNLLRPVGSELPIRTPLMFLVVFYGAMPNSFPRQIAAPLLYSAGLLLQRIFWLYGDRPNPLGTDLVVLGFVNIVGIIMVKRRTALEAEAAASWRREHEARAEAERTLQELRVLRGIIRVCSYCRKVPNEAGAWQQIEAYVRDHSHAEFSHGICPACLGREFPGTADRRSAPAPPG